jgi:FkbM family methyltransferase
MKKTAINPSLPKHAISYSQYREDIILSALLDDIEKGFYVDVGANYPVVDSVTYSFYRRGWSGINIEPVDHLCEMLSKKRSKDTNLNIAVSNYEGVADFYEDINIHGHSSLIQDSPDESNKQRKYEVKVKTLESIFVQERVKTIHFLKIDVEGSEYEVLEGNDWKKYRPEVICIESNHQSTENRIFDYLVSKKYKRIIFDGLNEYYIREESTDRLEGFVERLIKLDYVSIRQHFIQSWKIDINDRDMILGTARNQEVCIEDLKNKITSYITEINSLKNQAKRLSLQDKGVLLRLKTIAYGLIVDMPRFYIRRRRNNRG